MNTATTIARILLGILFVLAGASAFFMTPPPEPGLAGAFNDVFYRSHWLYFVAVAQLTLGTLLLVNRFVPVALIMLAAFLYNSFAFHLTMAQSSLPAPVLVFALWAVVSLKYRTLFAPLFAAKPQLTDPVQGWEGRLTHTNATT
ncbi:MAG: DoxX family membrane protein [Candidatus Eremiobacteraeota bacterium]|nr:DoxX family membrane protein [Candidatus Eremiobacteraeota bacterium]